MSWKYIPKQNLLHTNDSTFTCASTHVILIKSPTRKNFHRDASSQGLDELEAALQKAELEGAPLCKVGEDKVHG